MLAHVSESLSTSSPLEQMQKQRGFLMLRLDKQKAGNSTELPLPDAQPGRAKAKCCTALFDRNLQGTFSGFFCENLQGLFWWTQTSGPGQGQSAGLHCQLPLCGFTNSMCENWKGLRL